MTERAQDLIPLSLEEVRCILVESVWTRDRFYGDQEETWFVLVLWDGEDEDDVRDYFTFSNTC